MFFGISQPYIIDIYGFYFGEYMPGYLGTCPSINYPHAQFNMLILHDKKNQIGSLFSSKSLTISFRK